MNDGCVHNVGMSVCGCVCMAVGLHVCEGVCACVCAHGDAAVCVDGCTVLCKSPRHVSICMQKRVFLGFFFFFVFGFVCFVCFLLCQ